MAEMAHRLISFVTICIAKGFMPLPDYIQRPFAGNCGYIALA